MFNVNDYVVYQYWVCKVTDIQQLDYSNMGFEKDVTYYLLDSVYERESFCIPVTHEDSLRRPLTKTEALELIDGLPELESLPLLSDSEYREVMHTYDCYSYARVLKGLHDKSEYVHTVGKRLSNVDGKYLHLAEKYLHDELAFALGMQPNTVQQYITERVGAM